jgi:hypothetical protein
MRVVIPVRNDRTLTDHQVEKWGFDWLTTPDAIDRLTKIAAEMAQPGRNCGRYIDDGTADQQLVGMVGHIAAASPTRIALLYAFIPNPSSGLRAMQPSSN